MRIAQREARPERAAPYRLVFVLPDLMGGVANVVANLLEARPAGGATTQAILTRNPLVARTRFEGELGADCELRVEHTVPRENLYSALRRLQRALAPGPGVLVANDWLELALTAWWDPGKAVLQLVHGDCDYYYDLAVRHHENIHAFVCGSAWIAGELERLLPGRGADIHHLPYGIAPAPRRRRPRDGPLRLAYCGRMDRAKGVCDLPRIEAALRARGVAVHWTLIGAGPDESEARALWTRDAKVRWVGHVERSAARSLLADHDVFALPSYAEGLPLSLLEAMAAGLVPVTSRLRSGVPELVIDGETGRLADPGDAEGFAAAIAELDADRSRLEELSRAAAARVRLRHELHACAGAYYALFERLARAPRPPWRRSPVPGRGRLDRPWLPNALVRTARAFGQVPRR